MDERIYLTILYDYYGELFNPKQREYFEDYYFNNLSLSEISENLGVSRNAVHKQIKNIENKLRNYENILKLYQKSIKLKEIIEDIKNEKIRKTLIEIFFD